MKNTNNVTFTKHKLNKGKIVTFLSWVLLCSTTYSVSKPRFLWFGLGLNNEQWTSNPKMSNIKYTQCTNTMKWSLSYKLSNNQLARQFGSISLCHSGYTNITWKRYKLHNPVCVSRTYLLCCYKKKRLTYHFPIVSQPLLFDGQVCLLVEQLFDILYRCEGRDLVGLRANVLMTNCHPWQPKKYRHKFCFEFEWNLCLGRASEIGTESFSL